MKAVVTGATGFVGTWLVRELLSQGHSVSVILRDKTKLAQDIKGQVHIVEADLAQISELQEALFVEQDMDLFFHFAWAGTSGMDRASEEIQLSNVQYTCDAVRLAKRLHCSRFIYAGSIMEYEAMQYIADDGTRPGLGNIYSTAKLTADFMAKTLCVNEGMSYINVLISNIYGAGEYSARFLNTTMRKLMQNEPVALTHGEQLYDFIYVTDAVRAICLAAVNGQENETYYIGHSKQKPLKEFVLELKQVLDSSSKLGFWEVPFAGAMLQYNEFDAAKLETLGFVPQVSFADGVTLTKRWMMEVMHE